MADGAQKSWWPTRKLWAGLISGLLTIAAHAVGSGGWDAPESAELLTLLGSLSMAYFVPNDATPGGVPPKK